MITPLSKPSEPVIFKGDFRFDLFDRLCQLIANLKSENRLAGITILCGSIASARYLEYLLAQAKANLLNVRVITLNQLVSLLADPGQIRQPLPPQFALLSAYSTYNREKNSLSPLSKAGTLPGFIPAVANGQRLLDEAGIGSLPPLGREGNREWERYEIFKAFRKSYLEHKALFIDQLEVIGNITLSSTDFRAKFGGDNLLFYGIYDFNEVQFSLVNKLVKELSVSFFIGADQKPQRINSVTGLSGEIVTRLSTLFKVHLVEPENSTVLRLFDYEVSDSDLASLPDFQVIESEDPVKEVEAIVATIGSLISQGKAPLEDIGVVVWDSARYGDILRHSLRYAGIPFYDGLKATLAEPALEGLAHLLTFESYNLKRIELIDLLAGGLIKPPPSSDPNLLTKIEYLTVKAGIVAGDRSYWTGKITDLKRRNNDFDEFPGVLEIVTAYIEGLFDVLEGLEKADSFSGQFASLGELIENFLIDGNDKEELKRTLAGFRNLNSFPLELTSEQFKKFVNALISSSAGSGSRPIESGVALLTPLTVRGITFRHLFIPGMTSKSIPAHHTEHPILTNEILGAINRSVSTSPNLPLKTSIERNDEEKQLFQLLVNSAQEKIWFSYPAREIASGQKLLPSHFLLEYCRLITGKSQTAESIGQLSFHVKNRFSGTSDFMIRPRDFALGHGRRLSDDQKMVFFKSSGLFDHTGWQASWDLLEKRGKSFDWNEYEGMTGERESLAFEVAITTLEAWAGCPHRSWWTKEMNLKTFDEPEVALELDALVTGSIVHKVLEIIFNQKQSFGRFKIGTPELEGEVARLVHRVSERFRGSYSAPEGVWQISLRQITRRISRALPELIRLTEGWNIDSIEPETDLEFDLTLENGDKLQVTLKGRLDRVDELKNENGVRVLDYKTGKTKDPNKFLGGQQLQLPLYLYIVLKKEPKYDILKSLAGYVGIDPSGKVSIREFSGELLTERNEELFAILSVIVGGIRAGANIPMPSKDHCDYCPVESVCDFRSRQTHRSRSNSPLVSALTRIREEG